MTSHSNLATHEYAMFASGVSCRAAATGSTLAAIQCGSACSAALMNVHKLAREYKEHPDTASQRTRWARGIVTALNGPRPPEFTLPQKVSRQCKGHALSAARTKSISRTAPIKDKAMSESTFRSNYPQGDYGSPIGPSVARPTDVAVRPSHTLGGVRVDARRPQITVSVADSRRRRPAPPSRTVEVGIHVIPDRGPQRFPEDV